MAETRDPNTMEDEQLRHVVITLMNLVETVSGNLKEQTEDIHRLHNENHRLKGEQGKPGVKANTAAGNLSAEQERREGGSQGHGTGSTQQYRHRDRVEDVTLDPQDVPSDAVFKGDEEVMGQEVVFRPETTVFRKEQDSSPGHQRTSLAQVPVALMASVNRRCECGC